MSGYEFESLPFSQFGEIRVTELTPLIELNGAMGPTLLRDVLTETNGGTVTAGAGDIKISSNATASGFAQIKSAEAGRYVPGFGAQIGLGIRIPTAPTGNQYSRWGGITPDSNDGLIFGSDAAGLYTARISGGVVSGKTYSADWNIDPLDGTGPSGVTIDLAAGNIFHIDFTYYGNGQILWGIVEIVDSQQKFIPCHSFKPSGSVSIESPNMQVFAESGNGGDTSNFDAYVGGRQYSILGKYIAAFRFSGQYRGSVATTTTAKPLVTFKGKTAFLDRAILLGALTLSVTTEPVIAEIRINGTLTGASYINPTNHTATETALEVDVSATAITGGIVIWSDFFEAGLGSKAVLDDAILNMRIPQGQPVSLCVRTLTGTGSVVSFMRMKEEW